MGFLNYCVTSGKVTRRYPDAGDFMWEHNFTAVEALLDTAPTASYPKYPNDVDYISLINQLHQELQHPSVHCESKATRTTR
jgi:hypothetical protein